MIPFLWCFRIPCGGNCPKVCPERCIPEWHEACSWQRKQPQGALSRQEPIHCFAELSFKNQAQAENAVVKHSVWDNDCSKCASVVQSLYRERNCPKPTCENWESSALALWCTTKQIPRDRFSGLTQVCTPIYLLLVMSTLCIVLTV